jgi:hypothetical protein
MCVVVSNREKPMDTTASSFRARKNAKRAAEKMIADGKAPAVDYGIRPRDDGRFEIVWKKAPTNGEIEAEIATAASAAEGWRLHSRAFIYVVARIVLAQQQR